MPPPSFPVVEPTTAGGTGTPLDGTDARPSLTGMRAVQITRFGGAEVLDVVDLSDPVSGEGQTLYDISSCAVDYADTHHRLSAD